MESNIHDYTNISNLFYNFLSHLILPGFVESCAFKLHLIKKTNRLTTQAIYEEKF